MLYHVQMDVHPPPDVDPARFEKLKAEEKAMSQELQRSGKWRHLWRIAGRYAISACSTWKTMTSCTRSSPRCRCFRLWKSR